MEDRPVPSVNARQGEEGGGGVLINMHSRSKVQSVEVVLYHWRIPCSNQASDGGLRDAAATPVFFQPGAQGPLLGYREAIIIITIIAPGDYLVPTQAKTRNPKSTSTLSYLHACRPAETTQYENKKTRLKQSPPLLLLLLLLLKPPTSPHAASLGKRQYSM